MKRQKTLFDLLLSKKPKPNAEAEIETDAVDDLEIEIGAVDDSDYGGESYKTDNGITDEAVTFKTDYSDEKTQTLK